jgi:hypothetical protein
MLIKILACLITNFLHRDKDKSRDSSVITVTMLQAIYPKEIEFDWYRSKCFFSPPKFHMGSGVQTASYPVVTNNFYTGGTVEWTKSQPVTSI